MLVHAAALRSYALGVWLLAATLLMALTLATAVHWLRFPENARGRRRDSAMAPFYGAPPMAMLTVGAGALLVGKDLIGLSAAVTVDEILWALGTLTGLATTILIPCLIDFRTRAEARTSPGRSARRPQVRASRSVGGSVRPNEARTRRSKHR
jgi:tellurite resistance protein TehA-like permease